MCARMTLLGYGGGRHRQVIPSRAAEKIANTTSALDSLGANYAQITRNVEAGLRPGAIIEMHENRGQTIRALTTLLPALHNRHLRSVSVPHLLASDPPSVQQVRAGLAGRKREGELPTRPAAE